MFYGNPPVHRNSYLNAVRLTWTYNFKKYFINKKSLFESDVPISRVKIIQTKSLNNHFEVDETGYSVS